MTPEEAKKYLLAVRETLLKSSVSDKSGYVAAMDTALEALSPPKGKAHFVWAFIPDADMTPYEDLERVATLSLRMDGVSQEEALTLDRDERNLVYIALVCYQSILRGLYRERALKEVENIMRTLAENGTGGEETSC